MLEMYPILGTSVMGFGDFYIASLILLVSVYLVYREFMAAGLPKHYADNYLVTTSISAIGSYLFFLLIHFLAKERLNTGIPYLSLLQLDNLHFFDVAVAYLGDFSLMLVMTFVHTAIFIFAYIHYFKEQMRLNDYRLLLPSYIKALQLILIYSAIVLCGNVL